MDLNWLTPLLLFGATCAAADNIDGYSPLDAIPKECRVRAQASSWDALIATSRPTCILSQSLLLWCKSTGSSTWTFDLAVAFPVDGNGSRCWVLLDEPENWTLSDFQGEFVSGTATYPSREHHDGVCNGAERVGSSMAWGEVYKLSFATVPGGNHANQSAVVVLAWHCLDGGWEVLWQGREEPVWSLGSETVNDTQSFSVVEQSGRKPTIAVVRDVRYSPSHEDSPDRPFNFSRRGTVGGIYSMQIAWETPWLYTAVPGDTWERLAQTLSTYSRFRYSIIPNLKRDSGLPLDAPLLAGQEVVLPEGIRP